MPNLVKANTPTGDNAESIHRSTALFRLRMRFDKF